MGAQRASTVLSGMSAMRSVRRARWRGGEDGGEARAALVVEERREFLGRAGEQDDELAEVLAERAGEGGVQPLAGRGAVAVGQHLRAFDHVGLLAVVGRHGDLAAP